VTFTDFFAIPKMQGFGTVDNINGEITGIYELTTPFVGVGTEGTWITIEFTAIDSGTSPITMDRVGLPDETGVKIEPVTVNNGEVIVIEYFDLTIGVVGHGTTVPVPGVHIYTNDVGVCLEAFPDAGWEFDAWSGDITTVDNPTTITIDGNKSVTATFTQIEYTIITSTSGTGSGAIEVTPVGPYYYNDEVTLSANADAGSMFTGWYEDLTGTTNPETHIITSNIEVTAEFTLIEYTLTINIVGSGYVTKDPEQATYHYGDNVQLHATVDNGWIFSDWSGDMVSTDNPDTITIDDNNIVTATFIHADIYPPEITGVTLTTSNPIDTDPLYGWENVSCTIIDTGVGIDEVKFVVTYNSITTEYPMVKNGDTYYYNTTLTDVGDHIYKIWANDTINNIAQSTPETFILPPNCEADMNYGTRIIDFWDLVEIVKYYGDTGTPGWIREDVDNNGVVDFWDLVEVVKYYGETW